MKKYTEEEISLIRTCYNTRGVEWLSRELNRSAGSIRVKAYALGLRASRRGNPASKKEVREVGRASVPDRYIKADNLTNYDEEGLLRAQQAEAAASAGKVMLRVDERTHILVPRHLATPEYAAKVRSRWNKSRNGNFGRKDDSF